MGTQIITDKAHLTSEEAAEWLGLEESTLRGWRSDETGPRFVRISSRCVRYPMEFLIKWRNDRIVIPSVRAVVEDSHVG